ncbi:MAG: hypothetical protein WDN69_11785 [Aliidongia sp.]
MVDPLADDLAASRRPIVAATDGRVLSRRSIKLVAPGDTVAKVVGEIPLAYRSSNLMVD